jgi:hypothetical protein
MITSKLALSEHILKLIEPCYSINKNMDYHKLTLLYERDIKNISIDYKPEFFFQILKFALDNNDQENLVMFLKLINFEEIVGDIIDPFCVNDMSVTGYIAGDYLRVPHLFSYLISIAIPTHGFLHEIIVKWAVESDPRAFDALNFKEHGLFLLYLNVLLSLTYMVYCEENIWPNLSLIQSKFPVRKSPIRETFLNQLPISGKNTRYLNHKGSFYIISMMKFFNDEKKGFHISNAENINSVLELMLFGSNDDFLNCLQSTNATKRWIEIALYKKDMTPYQAITLCKHKELKVKLLELIL